MAKAGTAGVSFLLKYRGLPDCISPCAISALQGTHAWPPNAIALSPTKTVHLRELNIGQMKTSAKTLLESKP